jgi:phosphoglycolate phosphatase
MNLSREKTNWVVSNFHSVIGWSVEKNDVVPSAPLSASSWADILDITADCLLNTGLNVGINEVSCWHQSLGDIHTEDPPLINNLPHFLKYLKGHGMLISICTSDDRSSTTACMRNWQIEHLVDYSICGNEVKKSKPSPQPLLDLCRQAGVMPHECLVVGDTSSDMGMGVNGGAGLVVGVLTGSGTKKQLFDTGAHVVLPNISHLVDLLRCSLPLETTSSSTTIVSVESDASIFEEKKDDDLAASLLVSMKTGDYDVQMKTEEELLMDDDDGSDVSILL